MLGNFNKSIFVPELILVFLIKSGLFFSHWLKSRWRNDLVGWEMLRMLWLCFTFVDLCVNMCGVKSSKGSTIHQTLVTIGSSTIKVTWSSNIWNIYPLHKYRQNKSSTVQKHLSDHSNAWTNHIYILLWSRSFWDVSFLSIGSQRLEKQHCWSSNRRTNHQKWSSQQKFTSIW